MGRFLTNPYEKNQTPIILIPTDTLIPTLGSAKFDARGELSLAERLKNCLEDNAWVWHNIPVGPFGRHPDFVALHPQQGIVVLEVKDWRLEPKNRS